MRSQSYLFTFAILFLCRTAFSLAEETHQSQSKQTILKNLARQAEKNQQTCSDDIEEILYYLQLGRADIQRTEVKDIVIVLGLSGVGKSTLTQFVANETNKLRAECDEWEDECWIIDDSGTIGEDLISKTFLPNLVFHNSTQTPFYDMPGFNDNRNESMEIANAFFMQQVLEDAETVKVLVLARYSSFENSARLDFPNLLMNLVHFIKSPSKFRGGMAIISTMAPFHLTHDSIIRRNTRFLQESLLDDIGEIFRGREEYIRGSTEILENWLHSDTGNYYDTNYYSYFRTVSRPGPLLEDPLLFSNKEFLREIIWDRLKFIPKDVNDFGLPLSAAALRKLELSGLCISNSLTQQMLTFAVDLESYLRNKILNLVDGQETDIAGLSELLTNFTNSDFSFENMKDLPLSAYLQKLLSQVINLKIPSLNETRQQIEDTLSFIQFIELTRAELQFDPIVWVANILLVKGNLIRDLDSHAKIVQIETISSLAEESKIISEHLLSPIDSLNDISQKLDAVYSELVRVHVMFDKIEAVKRTTEKLTEFLDFYLSEYDQLKDCRQRCTFVPQLDVLNVLEILDPFSWSSMDWVSESVSNLQQAIEHERDFTMFLMAMFKDLSQPNIQTEENSELYTWWNDHAQITAKNFNDFFFIISSHGFTSSGLFDRTEVYEFVFSTPFRTKRLESLLHFMLEDIYVCPNSSEIVVIGAVISFDRVISRCINKQTTTSNISLIATYKMYANSKLIGRQINPNNNVNIVLMSPEIIIGYQSEIDLSGNAEKSAGTQYSLFGKISTTYDGARVDVITFPNLSGGIGVDGEVGSTGTTGSNGPVNAFNVNYSDDCGAWFGGSIQIRNYINSCNTCTTYNRPSNPDCYCYDKLIRIQGKSGYIGGRGENGKAGSCGGAGGQSYYVDANYFQLPKNATNGQQGRNGVGGAGGQGGLGGLYGNTLFAYIYNAGIFERWCAESYRVSEQSFQRAGSGANGSVGASCTSIVPTKRVNETTVANHFASFKAALQLRNDFLYLHALSFLSLLGNAQPI